jgi:membrane protease YdiL (CAAX protease family)
MMGALALSLLLPGALFTPDMTGLPGEMGSFKQEVIAIGIPPIFAMLLIGLGLGPTLNAVGALGEEIGWRGFLYKELAPLGFWRCSLVTGGLWALWHVPLFLEGYGDREHSVASGLGMIAFAILLAPILHLVRSQSGSVVACAILHGTMSSTRLITVAFVRHGGAWANAGIPIVLLATNAILFAGRKPLIAAATPDAIGLSTNR